MTTRYRVECTYIYRIGAPACPSVRSGNANTGQTLSNPTAGTSSLVGCDVFSLSSSSSSSSSSSTRCPSANRWLVALEWIKGLLAVPFVLCSQPTGVLQSDGDDSTALEAHRRYAEILRDVETMIDDHRRSSSSRVRSSGTPGTPRTEEDEGALEAACLPSKLKLLVPSVGDFFTRLPLEAAFKVQDGRRYISHRRFVAPSFNDVRLILNSAQVMALAADSDLKLVTFDGDLTLYADGESLAPDSPIIPRMLGTEPSCHSPSVPQTDDALGKTCG